MQAQASTFVWLGSGRIGWQPGDGVSGVVIPSAHKKPLWEYLSWGHGLDYRTLFLDWPGTAQWLQQQSPLEVVNQTAQKSLREAFGIHN